MSLPPGYPMRVNPPTMSALLCKVIEVGPTNSALSYGGGVDLIDFSREVMMSTK
jgi:hypothetical protein